MAVDHKIKMELKRKYKGEKVFVVPYATVSDIADGFTSMKHDAAIWSKFDNLGKYIDRYDVEREPSFQQIIPYILVVNTKTNNLFVSRRIAGEQRLLDKISVGFGGHINPCDGQQEVLFKALFRELHEELDVETIGPAKFVGYVRGLSSETNDHLGCVFVVVAENAAIKEHENLVGEWMSLQDLEKNYFKLEGWAKSIVDYLVTNQKF